LSLIDLLQNLVEICHRSGGRVVERFVGHQLADGALAGADAADDLGTSARCLANWSPSSAQKH